eukprot:TRINITY_DN119_c1_g3_i3.p1 TRINITY_DN119_c1_g3~~TRINITY_DN119_c1_g3_i3.p1  ORF type:complete len:256 (-),score=110.83 TRINITY_DN119_c1_g3_i3:136-903(-)
MLKKVKVMKIMKIMNNNNNNNNNDNILNNNSTSSSSTSNDNIINNNNIDNNENNENNENNDNDDNNNIKSKLFFDIVLGPLQAKAIVIMSHESSELRQSQQQNEKLCLLGHHFQKHPMLTPNFQGSQVFVYTPNSAIEWRKEILSKYFIDKINNYLNNHNNNHNNNVLQSISIECFFEKLNEIAQKQLDETLHRLPPATGVNLFSVQISNQILPSNYSNISNLQSLLNLNDTQIQKSNLLTTIFSFVNNILDNYL